MGDRGQVLIEDMGIYLYTHWTSGELPQIVKKALARKQRWNDEEYLTRIIFSEMLKHADALDDETGFGIGNSEHFDINRLIIINVKNKTVENRDGKVFSFEEYAKGGH